MITIDIHTEKDVALARMHANQLAKQMGLDTLACAEVSLAVSEICSNVIKHAQRGGCELSLSNQDKILEVKISDQGPGIANIALAMQEGFSSNKNSLGLGLEVAERSMDSFHIRSIPQQGTTVLMQKFKPLTADEIQYGIISLSDENYQFNGDAYFIKEFDGDKVLLGIIDGLGQGYQASLYSSAVKKTLEQNYRQPLDKLIVLCDDFLKEKNMDGSVAVSLLLLQSQKMQFCGIGDTHCYYQTAKDIQALFQVEGTIGLHQFPSLKLIEKELSSDSCFILCTDGIKTQINFDGIDWTQNPQQIAHNIFNDYHKTYGDVSILVCKYYV